MAVGWAPALALTSALGFGVAGVLLKRGLQHARPLAAAVVSVSVTTVFIWVLAALTVELALVLTWKVLPFVLAGLVAPGLGRLSFFVGIDRVGVARATSINSTAPLYSVTLAMLFLGERPSPPLLIGVAAIVVGGALLSYRHRTDLTWRRRDMIFPVLAALSFAVRDNISRWGLQDYAEPLIAAAVAAATSLCVMWLVTALCAPADTLKMPRRGLVFVAASGLSEGVAYLSMWRALSLAHVSVVSPLVNAHSIFAVALAALFLRDLERVTWRMGIAAVLIVAGVFAVVRFGAA